nr:DUF4476 domain-containing protein [uncultured Lacibacter sp.]
MKKIFTLFTFLFITLISFAAFDEARLSITTMSNEPVRVMIDGRQVQQGKREIRISNLSPGNHRVQIYSISNRRKGLFGNNRDELIYNSNVNIRRGMHTDIIINRFGKVFIDEQRMDNRYDDEWNNDRGGWNNDGWGNNNGNNGGWNNNNNGGWGNNNGNNRNQPMDYQRFQQLKQSVERSNFDKDKMELLRSVLPNNPVNAQQVKELAYLFSFEQGRLDFAKFAYRYTTDRSNYFVVNDVFNFGNSKTELTRYISSYRD